VKTRADDADDDGLGQAARVRCGNCSAAGLTADSIRRAERACNMRAEDGFMVLLI
jgi:hypothetical protein